MKKREHMITALRKSEIRSLSITAKFMNITQRVIGDDLRLIEDDVYDVKRSVDILMELINDIHNNIPEEGL